MQELLRRIVMEIFLFTMLFLIVPPRRWSKSCCPPILQVSSKDALVIFFIFIFNLLQQPNYDLLHTYSGTTASNNLRSTYLIWLLNFKNTGAAEKDWFGNLPLQLCMSKIVNGIRVALSSEEWAPRLAVFNLLLSANPAGLSLNLSFFIHSLLLFTFYLF